MMCMHCQAVQPVAQDCGQCHARLGDYFCGVCKLWDSDASKHIYHCDKCGICRIGKGLGQDYFHCDKCNVCMALHLQDNHRCIERNLECDCPICGDYMFTSTHTVIFMVISMSLRYSSLAILIYTDVVSLSLLSHLSLPLLSFDVINSPADIVSTGNVIRSTSKTVTSAQSAGSLSPT